MRGLIVNADDLGLSPGVNRGIAEAHRDGILTSTSLMVDTPYSAEAAEIGAEHPRLSVGLHADLTATLARLEDADRADACAEELERQIARFYTLTGHLPMHLDSHHNVHRRPELGRAFEQVGRRHGIRVRDRCTVKYVSSFYGQWGGRTHPEQISVEGFERILRAHGDELIELACHPGYADDALHSSYRHERELELCTLCDDRLPPILESLGYVLLDSMVGPSRAGALVETATSQSARRVHDRDSGAGDRAAFPRHARDHGAG